MALAAAPMPQLEGHQPALVCSSPDGGVDASGGGHRCCRARGRLATVLDNAARLLLCASLNVRAMQLNRDLWLRQGSVTKVGQACMHQDHASSQGDLPPEGEGEGEGLLVEGEEAVGLGVPVPEAVPEPLPAAQDGGGVGAMQVPFRCKH